MSWAVVPLKNICEITMGQAPSGDTYNENGNGYPLIAGAGDLGKKYPIPKKFTTSASKKSKTGDIVLCIRATIGDLNWSDKEYCLGRGVVGLRVSKNLDSKYLWYFLEKNKLYLNSLGTGSTFKQIGRTAISDLKIPLPPLEEQKRIAAILDKADVIRQKRQQAIELADEFLRSVFLDMFGPEVDKDNWPLVTFTDVTTIDAAMVDPRDDLYLDMLHIGPDRIEKNTGKLLPALTARDERLISKKFLFNEEYVLYSKIRPYLRKVALPNFTGLCSADMYPVKPTKNVMTREYLWQLLLSDAFTQYTETLPNRANIPKLNRAELASYEFKLPPMQLQNKFTDIYKKYSKSLLQLNKAQIKSESVFSSLNQKAFSGQL